MANTTNIDLVKPAGTDHALVSVLNANSDKIDAEAGNVRSNFALVQNTNTATQAISKDQLVAWKGVLKKATSNIANGATLSNSNLTDTKVSTELASLSDQIGTRLEFKYLKAVTSSDTFSLSNSSMIILAGFNIYTNGEGTMFMVTTNSSGTVRYTKIGGGSNVTLSVPGANSITVTVSAEQRIFALILQGGIST